MEETRYKRIWYNLQANFVQITAFNDTHINIAITIN